MVLLAVYLGVLGVLSLPASIWAFGVANRITAATPSTEVRWLGPDFTADALTSCLVLAAVAGIVGSLVHAGNLFSRRVARHTFEDSFLIWYLLRPVLSALLAVAFVTLVRGGLMTASAQGADSSTPMLAFGIGVVAGLFLDTVLQTMRALLGASAVDVHATAQDPPEGGAG